jgi:hypothetical protein
LFCDFDSGQRFAPAAKNIGDATKLRVPASYAMLFFGEEDVGNRQNSSLLILDELEIQPFTENHR